MDSGVHSKIAVDSGVHTKQSLDGNTIKPIKEGSLSVSRRAAPHKYPLYKCNVFAKKKGVFVSKEGGVYE